MTDTERRYVWRVEYTVCLDGHVMESSDKTARELAAQIRCQRGHWTWADGRFCGECGVRLELA